MDIHVLESDVLSHVLQHYILEDLEDCTHQWHTGIEGFRVRVNVGWLEEYFLQAHRNGLGARLGTSNFSKHTKVSTCTFQW